MQRCRGCCMNKIRNAGTWTMTLVPGAPEDNTYNIVNALRPDAASTCNGNLSCARCPGTGVDQFGVVSDQEL